MASAQTEFDVEIDPSTYSKTMNGLPDEMLLKIFSYLSVEEICFSLSYVCERWNCLTKEHSLWKTVKFICNKDMTVEHIFKVLTQASMLTSIELQWRTDTSIIIKTLCSICKDIRNIYMVCCGKIIECSILLLIEEYPLLEVLSLDKCWAVQDSCYSIVYRFSNLRSINLSHSMSLNGSMLRQIVDSCQSLVKINIDYIRGILDDDLLYLIRTRKHNLVSLIMFGESLTDAAFCGLEECLNLQTLHLTRCSLMTDRGLRSISKLLKLRSLKLRLGINLSSEALADFFMKQVASNLEYLCLSRSEKFDDLAAMNIATNCVNLKHLDVLYCPNLTEQGRNCILSGCKLLKIFNFTKNALNNSIIVVS